MNLVKRTNDQYVIQVTWDELRILLNAINETLEAVEDWELPIRVGAEVHELKALQSSIRGLREQAND
jgi:hypothetical protein